MEAAQRRPVFVFVGAFAQAAADGTRGGQAFACRALVASGLSQHLDWKFVDSTMRSQPPPHLVIRGLRAGWRILEFEYKLLSNHARGTLIFSAYEPTSFLEKGVMALLARLQGRRVVLSIRSEIRSHTLDRILLPFRKRVVHCADSIICQSDEAARAMETRLSCDPKKIRVVPNWIDASAYADIARPETRDRSFTFLFMGWVEPFKGIRELLRAAAFLADRQCAFKLIVCGGGSDLEHCKKMVSRLDIERRVEFRGWVDGPAKVRAFADADAFVLPSHSEGMPNSVLEAMAAALPVVATRVGGIPAIVTSEINGILVPPRDAEMLAEAMERLARSPKLARRMGKTNSARVRENHDIHRVWPRVAAALLSPPDASTIEGPIHVRY